MQVDIRRESPDILAEYERIPIAFLVTEQLIVHDSDAGVDERRLVLEHVSTPYIKDYDAHDDSRPTSWPERFDLTGWGIFSAFVGSELVGGAAVAWKTPSLELVEHRSDVALLWDLRVRRDYRRNGVGSLLVQAAEVWARAQGAHWLKVETQNVNVPACRFYERQGFALGSINRFAYPELPSEIQFLFYKQLAAG